MFFEKLQMFVHISHIPEAGGNTDNNINIKQGLSTGTPTKLAKIPRLHEPRKVACAILPTAAVARQWLVALINSFFLQHECE